MVIVFARSKSDAIAKADGTYEVWPLPVPFFSCAMPARILLLQPSHCRRALLALETIHPPPVRT